MSVDNVSHFIENGDSFAEVTTSSNLIFRCRVGEGHRKSDPIILLHGFPETSRMWKKSIEFFTSKGYPVFAPDLRGYSPKARPINVEDYTIDKLSDDVIEISERFKLEKFHLIAHDWGASVGWYLTAKNPKKVISFTSLSIPHLNAFSYSIKNNFHQRLKIYYITLFQIKGLPEIGLKLFNYKILRAHWSNKHNPEEIESYIKTLSEKNALKAALNWYRAYPYNKISNLESISVPTLLIYGNKDKYIGRHAIEETEKYIDEYYKLKILDASHWLIQDSFEEVVNEILFHIQTNKHKNLG